MIELPPDTLNVCFLKEVRDRIIEFYLPDTGVAEVQSRTSV
jgi:hypothetical protein